MEDEKWKEAIDQSLESITASEELIRKTLRAVKEETGKEKRTVRKGQNRFIRRMAFSAAGILVLAAGSWCFLVLGNQSKNNSAQKIDMESQTEKEWGFVEPEYAGPECAEGNAAQESRPMEGEGSVDSPETSGVMGDEEAFILSDRADQIQIRKSGAGEARLLTDPEQIEALAGILAKEEALTEEPRDREAGWKYQIIFMSGQETERFWIPEDHPDIQKLDELYGDLLEN